MTEQSSTESVELRDPGAGFATGLSLRPSKVEALENGGWPMDAQGAAPDQEPEESEAQSEEEPEAPSQEPDEVPDEAPEGVEPEADPEAPEESETPPEGISEKANQRFRKLARERKAAVEAAAATNAKLAEMSVKFAELLEVQRSSTELQRSVYERAMAQQTAAESTRQRLLLEEQLMAAGYQPGTFAHDMIMRQAQETAELQRQLTAAQADFGGMRQEMVAAGRLAQETRYKTVLSQQFDAALKGREIPQETRAELERQAYSVAVAQRLTPDKATEATLRHILPLLKKAGARPPKTIPDAQRVAHDAVATRGRTGTRRAGESVNGQGRKKTVEEIEREQGAGRDW